MLRLMVIGLFLFLLLAGCENRTPKAESKAESIAESKADKIKVLEAQINMCNRKIDELRVTATGDGTIFKKAAVFVKLQREAEEKLDALLSNK